MKQSLIFIFCLSLVAISAQDDYHLELAQQLESEFGLTDFSYGLSDNEDDNLSDVFDYGDLQRIDEPIDDFVFSMKSNINVRSVGNAQWDAGYGISTPQAISSGDAMLVVFWARSLSSASDIFAFGENSSSFEKDYYINLSFTQDWSQYFIRFSASSDYAPGSFNFGFHLASVIQELDIAGFTVLNFGAIPLENLPTSFGEGGYDGSEEDAPWREIAANRIEQIRKADMNVKIIDHNGNPVSSAKIDVAMQSHEFEFGSAVVACRFPGNNCYDETYMSKLTDLDGEGHGFNASVMENAMKWDGWEEEWLGTPAQTTSAVEWLADNGLTPRGHTLFWPAYRYMPDDISENRTDLEYIRNRMNQRMTRMLMDPTLSSAVREWDIVNEITQNRDFENIFRSDSNFTTGREIYQEIFQKARDIDANLRLYINDYVVLSGGGSGSSVVNRYKIFLDELRDSDVPWDGIGFQCHIGSIPTSINKVESVLNEYFQRYGKRMKITEYDIDDNVDPGIQGRYLADFLEIIFSHPGVDGFIMWGFWDGNHWKNNAPMFDIDWNLKPSGQAFIDKVFHDWWTEELLFADEGGDAFVRGFKGDYILTVEHDGVTQAYDLVLSDDMDTTLVLDLSSSLQVLDSEYVQVSPNPIGKGTELNLHWELPYERLEYSFQNIEGKTVTAWQSCHQGQKISLDLASGSYILVLKTPKGELIQKAIKVLK